MRLGTVLGPEKPFLGSWLRTWPGWKWNGLDGGSPQVIVPQNHPSHYASIENHGDLENLILGNLHIGSLLLTSSESMVAAQVNLFPAFGSSFEAVRQPAFKGTSAAPRSST